MSTKKLIVALAALGVSAAAFAGGYVNNDPMPVSTAPAAVSNDGAGFVVGAQLGWADTHQANTFNDTVYNINNSGDDSGFAGRGYIGYDFNKYFGIESGYTFLPTTDYDNNAGSVDNYAIDLLAKITYPVNDVFSVFAKAGGVYLNQEIKEAGYSQTDDSITPAFGIGAAYQVMPNLAVDLSWTRYNGSYDNSGSNDYTTNVDFAALGVSYKFPVG